MDRSAKAEAVKKAVRARDGSCRRCGRTNESHLKEFGRSLDVHRKVAGAEYTMDNCEAMCRTCHGRIPKERDANKREDAIKAAGLKPAGLRPVLLGLSPDDAAILQAAARMDGRPMTQFILWHGLRAAEQILKEQ